MEGTVCFVALSVLLTGRGAARAASVAGVAALRPQAVGGHRPLGGALHAAVAEIPHAVGGFHLGAVRAGGLHHRRQAAGIVQHRAGAQMVLVPGLVVVVGHEQRALQRLQ